MAKNREAEPDDESAVIEDLEVQMNNESPGDNDASPEHSAEDFSVSPGDNDASPEHSAEDFSVSPEDILNDDPEELADAEIVAKSEEIAALKDQLARAQADFVNFRTRSQKEAAEVTNFVTANLLEKLLPVLDDIDRARGQNAIEAGSSFEAVANKFAEILQVMGVESFGAAGEAFDPQMHHAVLSNEADVDEPVIAEIVAKGYKAGERILRAAQVVVDAPRKG